MQSTYDRIGIDYQLTRQPDPRIAHRITNALGDSRSVVNVGAGTGSYEPRTHRLIAVEPSATMIQQRPPGAAPAVQAIAESLPLGDGAMDSALAILTLHHWSDPHRGLAQMRRVAKKRIVILTWDQDIFEAFWLIRDYFSCIREVDRPRALAIADIVSVLGREEVLPVPVPHDCVDGFLGAFWRRPEAYLDPRVRAGISAFAAMPPRACDEGLRRLVADLETGVWQDRHRDLLRLNELDLGYRLVVASGDAHTDKRGLQSS
jgi:SAM-dependent methyltransferase